MLSCGVWYRWRASVPEGSHTLHCTSCTSDCPRPSRNTRTIQITSSGTRHTLSYVIQHLMGSRPSTFHETGSRAKRRDREAGVATTKITPSVGQGVPERILTVSFVTAYAVRELPYRRSSHSTGCLNKQSASGAQCMCMYRISPAQHPRNDMNQPTNPRSRIYRYWFRFLFFN